MADQKEKLSGVECRLAEKPQLSVDMAQDTEESKNGSHETQAAGKSTERETTQEKMKDVTDAEGEEEYIAQHRKPRYVVKVRPRPLFWLRYNSLKNAYDSSDKDYEKTCWSAMLYESKNMDFNHEFQWETSYLARHEGCSPDQPGAIRWRFDLTDLGDRWRRVEIQVNVKLYPGTKVDLYAMSYDSIGGSLLNKVELEVSALNTLTAEQLKRTTRVVDLEATLSGGDDPSDTSSWQRPQLFRQTEWRDKEEWPFKFTVY